MKKSPLADMPFYDGSLARQPAPEPPEVPVREVKNLDDFPFIDGDLPSGEVEIVPFDDGSLSGQVYYDGSFTSKP